MSDDTPGGESHASSSHHFPLVETAVKEKDELSDWATVNFQGKYAWRDDDGNVTEKWADTARRVSTHVLGALGYRPNSDEVHAAYDVIRKRQFMPGGRYLHSTGFPLHQINNCFLLRVEDTREGWGDLGKHALLVSMTGGGVGVYYGDLRHAGSPLKRVGGVASGPTPLAMGINEFGRAAQSGGHRRAAIWGGLPWWHKDVFTWISAKDWSDEIRELKRKDFSFAAPLDMTNISVCLDDEFFLAYENESHSKHQLAHDVYDAAVKGMLEIGEPGLSVDTGKDHLEVLRNPCCEIQSADDSDVCNLGHLNLARISSKEEMRSVEEIATLFLLAGTVYSDVPYEKVKDIRERNRRLGLGLMGIHEWLLVRGYEYGPSDHLAEWLDVYAESTDVAGRWADEHSLSRPVKTRAIAPTGTTSIVAETTGGIEPVFATALKRRVREANPLSDKTNASYVVDPTAKRVMAMGVDPGDIEDSYTLAHEMERRVAFQAWMQGWVDHAISSTINLPAPIKDPDAQERFGHMLYRYLPSMKGVTVYPDGVIGGQPMTKVPLEEALASEGVTFEETGDNCKGGSCSI